MIDLNDFVIYKQINIISYKLYLLQSLMFHHLFDVSFFDLYKIVDILKRKKIWSLLIKMENNQEFEIEEVLD